MSPPGPGIFTSITYRERQQFDCWPILFCNLQSWKLNTWFSFVRCKPVQAFYQLGFYEVDLGRPQYSIYSHEVTLGRHVTLQVVYCGANLIKESFKDELGCHSPIASSILTLKCDISRNAAIDFGKKKCTKNAEDRNLPKTGKEGRQKCIPLPPPSNDVHMFPTGHARCQKVLMSSKIWAGEHCTNYAKFKVHLFNSLFGVCIEQLRSGALQPPSKFLEVGRGKI